MGLPEPYVVIVTGDAAVDERFLKIMEEVVPCPQLESCTNHTIFAATKGRAWLHTFGGIVKIKRQARLPEPVFITAQVST
jgi:hypothetical protein